MPNFPQKKRLWTAVGVAVPVAIFFAARSVASWRPQPIGVQPVDYREDEMGDEFLTLSPDEKWLASTDNMAGGGFIWNLDTNSKRILNGYQVKFSKDSHLVATNPTQWDEQNDPIMLEVQRTEGSSLWKRKLSQHERLIGFSEDGQLQTNQENLRHFFDANTGKLIRTLPPEVLPWRTTKTGDETHEPTNIIAYVPLGASKPEYSFQTTNKYDVWSLSADKSCLCVSLYYLARFNILDAQTGKLLWFYTSKNADSGTFFCYPNWEDGGKSLATIENDTLIVRDARTGKVLLSHKNNLPAPLKSWAFTKDGSAVYLMDAKGEIFRQRLR